MNGNNGENRRESHHGGPEKGSRGPSSAWMHDPKWVLGLLPLEAGHVFVDLGCGAGDYTMEASGIVGAAGRVYGVDKWPYLIDSLSKSVESAGLENVTLLKADITAPLPLEDHIADVVFLATVLHIFNLRKSGPLIFAQVSRILKPHGLLAIVECKKEDRPFGPPQHLRNSPEEVEAALAPFDFVRVGYHDLGYSYLIQFVRGGRDSISGTCL